MTGKEFLAAVAIPALIAVAFVQGCTDQYPDRVTVQNGAVRTCDGEGGLLGVGDYQQDAIRLCAEKE